MNDLKLVSGLIDAAFYVVPILIGAALWFIGRRRDPERPVMITVGAILVFIFGAGLVGRALIWMSSQDGLPIDSDTALVAAILIGTVVALLIIIPVAILAGKRIGAASVARSSGAATAAEEEAPPNPGREAGADPHPKSSGVNRVLLVAVVVLALLAIPGLVLSTMWLIDADDAPEEAAVATTQAATTTSPAVPTTTTPTLAQLPAPVREGLERVVGSPGTPLTPAQELWCLVNDENRISVAYAASVLGLHPFNEEAAQRLVDGKGTNADSLTLEQQWEGWYEGDNAWIPEYLSDSGTVFSVREEPSGWTPPAWTVACAAAHDNFAS